MWVVRLPTWSWKASTRLGISSVAVKESELNGNPGSWNCIAAMQEDWSFPPKKKEKKERRKAGKEGKIKELELA